MTPVKYDRGFKQEACVFITLWNGGSNGIQEIGLAIPTPGLQVYIVWYLSDKLDKNLTFSMEDNMYCWTLHEHDNLHIRWTNLKFQWNIVTLTLGKLVSVAYGIL